MNCSYIFRTEPSVSLTQKVYSLAEAVEFVQSGPSSPQNTMVHFFEHEVVETINKKYFFLCL